MSASLVVAMPAAALAETRSAMPLRLAQVPADRMLPPGQQPQTVPARPMPQIAPQPPNPQPRPQVLPPRPMPQQPVRPPSQQRPQVDPVGPVRPTPPPVYPPTQQRPQIDPGGPWRPVPPPPRPPITPPVVVPQPGGYWDGHGFAGQRECSSRDNRYTQCSANTTNRVVLVRQLSSNPCVQGRSWGYTRSHIWVRNGCRARFAYGHGNVRPDHGGGSGSGAAIAGVAVAAGLLAILASSGRKPNRPAEGSATLVADTSQLPPAERRAADLCLMEAARQVGVTGGQELRLNQFTTLQPLPYGWAFGAYATARYSNVVKPLAIDCRTENDRVSYIDFR